MIVTLNGETYVRVKPSLVQRAWTVVKRVLLMEVL